MTQEEQKSRPRWTARVFRYNSSVELPPSVQTTSGECVLEVENAGGVKMRMHLKGVAMPDLAAISRSFWNHQP